MPWEALAAREASGGTADDDWNKQADAARYDVLKRIARDGYTATTDFPACLLFEEQMVIWPDAKVVLSARRSGQNWIKSVAGTIGQTVYIFNRVSFKYLA